MVDLTKLATLLELLKTGEITKASYLKVEWSTGTKYYSSSAYADISPFRDIKKYTAGQQIEPRIMGDPFLKFEVNGDIRTENIDIEFDDTAITGVSGAGTIKALFANGAPKASIHLYYPQVDLDHTPWWGQLLPPEEPGAYTQRTTLTNGYRSAERTLPDGGAMPVGCRFTYAGYLNTLDKVRSNGCPKDNHLGGSVGITNDLSCPKQDKHDCFRRLGTFRFFGGTDLPAASFQSDGHPGNLAFTKGSRTIRNQPIPWIFGHKHINSAEVMLSARRPNQNHPDQAFITVIWRLCEGPVESIQNLKINDRPLEYSAWRANGGGRGQPTFADFFPSGVMDPDITYSSTAIFGATYGYVDPNVTASSLQVGLDVTGFKDVAVFSDVDTFVRRFSDDRVWCLIEMYTNQKCGLKYEIERFNIAEALLASEWGRQVSTFTLYGEDGEVHTFAGRRTTFDAVVEGRPAIEVIKDVCRSGRLFVPFQDDEKYTIVPDRPFTSDELDDAVVFSDHGEDLNIMFDLEPVQFSHIRDDKVINEITLTFEEARNFDIARPIVGNDPDQQVKASKIMGDDARNVVPTQVGAFGVRAEQEAVKLLYHQLRFGDSTDSETAGTMNNCFSSHICPYEWTLALRRYSPFKFDLTSQTAPTGPTGTAQVMTATAVGTATASGNITVTVTAVGLTGTPVAVTVPIANHDAPATWAAKVVTRLRLNTNINEFFVVRGSGANIILTARTRAANDATWNVAIAAGSTGITSDPTSTATTAGIADAPFEYFRCIGIKKLDNDLAQVMGIAYNRTAMENFEVESEGGGTGGVCSIDSDCDPGYVCVDGHCVPARGGYCEFNADCEDGFVCHGGICVPMGGANKHDPGIEGVTYYEDGGFFQVNIGD